MEQAVGTEAHEKAHRLVESIGKGEGDWLGLAGDGDRRGVRCKEWHGGVQDPQGEHGEEKEVRSDS